MEDIRIGDTVHVQATFKVTGINKSVLYDCIVVSGELSVPYERVKAPITVPIQYVSKLGREEVVNG